jgi:Uma2 family endonuclease
MSQVLIQLNDDSKLDILLAFLNSITYIDAVKTLPNRKAMLAGEALDLEEGSDEEDLEENSVLKEGTPLYYTPGHSYSYTEIQAIADNFPKDYQWTYAELQNHFPQNLKITVEIIRNQLFVIPSPAVNHQQISNELSFEITSFVKSNKLGQVICAPMDVKFDDDNVLQPDIIFIAVSRYAVIGEQCIEGAPDLVVEIWSPGNKKKERESKHRLYEEKGVTEYWAIYLKQRKITVEVLDENGKYVLFSEAKKKGKISSKILKGFEVAIESIFPVIKK